MIDRSCEMLHEVVSAESQEWASKDKLTREDKRLLELRSNEVPIVSQLMSRRLADDRWTR